MTERPILFSGPMVRAILSGQKTQTRRVVTVTRPKWASPDESLECEPLHGDGPMWPVVITRNTGCPADVDCPFGNRSGTARAIAGAFGKTIKSISHDEANEHCVLVFDDGELRLFDDGYSCCETRYMTTDDDLAGFAGAKFLSAEVRDAPEIHDEYGEHEVQFLRIVTDKGHAVFSNHNEHNGHYGGFSIKARWEPAANPPEASE